MTPRTAGDWYGWGRALPRATGNKHLFLPDLSLYPKATCTAQKYFTGQSIVQYRSRSYRESQSKWTAFAARHSRSENFCTICKYLYLGMIHRSSDLPWCLPTSASYAVRWIWRSCISASQRLPLADSFLVKGIERSNRIRVSSTKPPCFPRSWTSDRLPST